MQKEIPACRQASTPRRGESLRMTRGVDPASSVG